MSHTQSIRILIFSASLLIAALLGARAHAENRMDVIQSLQKWQQRMSVREDLLDREKDLRMQFISRLIFQTERKYKETPLQEFYIKTLKEMMKIDGERSNRALGSMTPFLSNLHESLESLLEKREDPLVFMENFMEFSGVQDPATEQEFGETRSYFDGRTMIPAEVADLNEVSAEIERREKSKDQARELSPEEQKWFQFQENLILDFIPPKPSASHSLQR